MAKAVMKLPDDLIKKISTLGDKTDEICKTALKNGAKVVETKMRSNLQCVVGKDTKYDDRSTGELIKALGVTPVLIDKNGNYNIKIGFNQTRKDGVSNTMLANIIEYGKLGQPPKPFLKPTKLSSKKQCLDSIKSTLESEIQKI